MALTRRRPATEAGEAREWRPAWARDVGVPLWISGPDRRIVHANGAAAALLGTSSEDCLGRPCFDLVAASDAEGRRFCGRRCPLFRRALRRLPATPVTVAIVRPPEPVRWLSVLGLAVDGPDDRRPFVVHLASEITHLKRMEEHLQRVSMRHAPGEVRSDSLLDELTPREAEVLGLLVADHDTAAIARLLFISRTTVRNHVQHLIRKLRVHSIEEAVALALLHRADGEPDGGPDVAPGPGAPATSH